MQTHIITEATKRLAAETIAKSFCAGEPLAVAIHLPFDAMFGVLWVLMDDIVEKQSGWITFDENGQVMGAVIARDLARDVPAEFKAKVNKDIIALLSKLDEGYYVLRGRVPEVGEVFDIWTVGVLPDAAGKGVGRTLMQKCIDYAKEKQFKYVVAECTSAFTQMIMVSLGARIRATIYYDEFAWTDEESQVRRPYVSIPAPHKFVALCEIPLKRE